MMLNVCGFCKLMFLLRLNAISPFYSFSISRLVRGKIPRSPFEDIQVSFYRKLLKKYSGSIRQGVNFHRRSEQEKFFLKVR